MAFDTGCHKCGGYPGAGGMKERAALYQCLKCGTYTCNNHLVGLVGRSCPACQNQKLKQVANKQSIAKRKKAETKMDKGGGGSSGKKQSKGGSKPEKQTVQERSGSEGSGGTGGGISFSGGSSDNVKVSAVAVYKGRDLPNIAEDVASQSIANIMAQLQNKKNDPSSTNKSAKQAAVFGVRAVEDKHTGDGAEHTTLSFVPQLGGKQSGSDNSDHALEAALAAGAPPPTLKDGDAVSPLSPQPSPKENTKSQTTGSGHQPASIGFWQQLAVDDENKRKKIPPEHWHDALFELDEPKFFTDSLQKLEKQFANKALACGVVALKLPPKDTSDWEKHLTPFSQSQYPIALSVVCQQGQMPDDDVWATLDHNPAVKALGPVQFHNHASSEAVETFCQHAMAVALKHNWVLLLDLPVGLKRSLKDMFTPFAERGGQAVLCGPALDEVGLELVQELGFYLAVRPEYSYPDRTDSQEFLSCLEKENLLIASGNELNAPQSERGNFNGPKYLNHTARFTASTLNTELPILAPHLRDNWLKLFMG